MANQSMTARSHWNTMQATPVDDIRTALAQAELDLARSKDKWRPSIHIPEAVKKHLLKNQQVKNQLGECPDGFPKFFWRMEVKPPLDSQRQDEVWLVGGGNVYAIRKVLPVIETSLATKLAPVIAASDNKVMSEDQAKSKDEIKHDPRVDGKMLHNMKTPSSPTGIK